MFYIFKTGVITFIIEAKNTKEIVDRLLFTDSYSRFNPFFKSISDLHLFFNNLDCSQMNGNEDYDLFIQTKVENSVIKDSLVYKVNDKMLLTDYIHIFKENYEFFLNNLRVINILETKKEVLSYLRKKSIGFYVSYCRPLGLALQHSNCKEKSLVINSFIEHKLFDKNVLGIINSF
jgi:hypothetical protein